MKLITFFLILGTLASSATSYSQVTKLDLRMRNSSVEEILKTIENSSEFIFIYDADLIKSLEKKSISVRGESVEEVLARLFDDEAVNYLIDDRQIFLFRKDVISQASVPETEEASIPPPQPKVISGSITDSQGDPLPGVNVLIKGTTTGTITDLNGRFQLSISPNDQILVISFIGMVTQEIPIGDRLVFNAIMEEDVVGFEEVVVVGYGVQRKESVVGAISVAQGEDIVRRGGVTNISSAITGLLPGVVTFNTVGKAGIDDAEILIRGKSTWNESAPLVLVDGVERNMNELDVNEVESISVLKDASATAVFGVRGANGIILITTKRGKTGKPVFNVSANTTLRTISKLPEYADSYTDLNFKNQSIELTIPKDNLAWGYYTPYEFLMHYKNQDMPYVFPDVDWQKETLRNSAISHKGLIDLRGGTEFVKYFTSLSYTYEGDIFRIEDFGQGYDPKNDLRRLNFRTNLDFQPTATTTFSVDIDGAYARIRDNSGSGWMNWNGLYGKAPYTHPVWHEDGTWGYNPVDDVLGVNPLHDFNFYGIRSRSRNDINATFRFDQKLNFITEGLSFQARVSTQNSYNTTGPTLDRNTQLKKYINPYTMEEESSATDNTTTGFNYLPDKSTTTTENPQTDVLRNLMYQTSLNYARRFGKHGFTGLLLFKRDERSLSDEFTAYREEWAGRITYDFDNRYLFETNAAYNGSEQFGPGYKFGFFPSYAVGWNVHNESFFSENVQFMNRLKIRFSTGIVGNDNRGIGARWLYLSSWKTGTTVRGTIDRTLFGNFITIPSPYPVTWETNIGNPNIQWETSKKNNFAVETGFFDNMITFNYDYFWEHQENIFMSGDQRNIPPWFGASPVAGNIGETKNWGSEFELGFNKRSQSGFSYYSNISLSFVKNEVIYMEDPLLTPDYQKKEGFPIDQTRATMYHEIIQNWDEMYTGVMPLNNEFSLPGQYRLVDYNADGIIDAQDEVPYGYTGYPQYMSSYTFGADYKGFSAMIQLYSTRNSTLNQSFRRWSSRATSMSGIEQWAVENSWLPGRTGSDIIGRASYEYPGNASLGHFNDVDGTQWRIKTAEIAYTFTGSMLERVGVTHLRIFANGHNLWLWSHLNEDRERPNTRSSDTFGFDNYPMLKRWNFGINVTF